MKDRVARTREAVLTAARRRYPTPAIVAGAIGVVAVVQRHTLLAVIRRAGRVPPALLIVALGLEALSRLRRVRPFEHARPQALPVPPGRVDVAPV
jgi:hypothetical protein